MIDKKQLSEMDRYAVAVIECRALALIGKFGLTMDDREDVVQQLFLEYLERVAEFDPAKSTYKTFVSCVVGNQLTSLVRSRRREISHGLFISAVADSNDGDADFYDQVVADDYQIANGRQSRSAAELMDLRLDVERTVQSLPPHLQRIATKILESGPTGAARNVDRCRTTVYRWMRQLRTAFERAGLSPLVRGA